MADVLTHQTATDPYDNLPEAIRQYYSRAEYMALSGDQKANIIQLETEPDPE